MASIKVIQKKSLISVPESQRKVMQGLGLNKIGQEKTHKDNNCIRGMINKVSHLIDYELLSK
ncbi:MAG: 50S ribosomal protein L30 [Pseudobacteriovorax sp.]|nr:50S ribosomal protein L30 [Pseudobacteriovorax sp.]